MRRRGFSRKRGNKTLIFILTVIILLISIFVVLTDTGIQSQLNIIAASQAKNISTRVINNAVIEVITANNIEYDDLVSIEYDVNNRVSVIKTNSIRMNWLQSAISSKIAEKISEVESYTVSVPFGSLFGIEYFNHLGPKIKIRMNLAGNATASIENVFESAGINQTRHQINLAIRTAVSVVMSNSSGSAEVLTNITIAETIIVGLVPEVISGSDDFYNRG